MEQVRERDVVNEWRIQLSSTHITMSGAMNRLKCTISPGCGDRPPCDRGSSSSCVTFPAFRAVDMYMYVTLDMYMHITFSDPR